MFRKSANIENKISISVGYLELFSMGRPGPVLAVLATIAMEALGHTDSSRQFLVTAKYEERGRIQDIFTRGIEFTFDAELHRFIKSSKRS